MIGCCLHLSRLDKKAPDGCLSKEIQASDLPLRRYKVIVHTGDAKGAGTDANVFISIFGEKVPAHTLAHSRSAYASFKGDSGRRKLNNSENNFERAHVDTFLIKNAELGKLTRIRIGHDDSGLGSAWLLSHVVVQCEETNSQWFFPCNKWYHHPISSYCFVMFNVHLRFSKTSDDHAIERDIPAADSLVQTKYKVVVCTGDIANAGTDSNVSIAIYGDKVCAQLACYFLSSTTVYSRHLGKHRHKETGQFRQ